MLLARGLIQLKLVPFEAAPAHHCAPSRRLGNCLFRFWMRIPQPLAASLPSCLALPRGAAPSSCSPARAAGREGDGAAAPALAGRPSALLRHPARPLQAWLKKAAPRHRCPSHGPSVAPKPHAGVASGEVQDRNSGIQKKFGKCPNCLILLCSPPKLNMFPVHNRLGLEVQAL